MSVRGLERFNESDISDAVNIRQQRLDKRSSNTSIMTNKPRRDMFERSSDSDIEHFSNYTKSGRHVCNSTVYFRTNEQSEAPMLRVKAIAEHETIPSDVSVAATENPAEVIVEQSRIDELTKMLKDNDLYMSTYTDRLIRFNTYKPDSFIEDEMPDEFRDVYVEFGYEVLKAQDQKEFLEYLRSLCSDTCTSKYNPKNLNYGLGNEVAKYLRANGDQFNIDKIIEGNDKTTQTVLRQALDTFLFNRALNGETLTASERLYSTYATHAEHFTTATFSQKMETVSLFVDLEIKKAQQNSLSDSKFTVSLNNEFTFVVSGDDENEARLLQNALNNKKGLLSYVIWSATYHRSEDGSYVTMNNQEKVTMPNNAQNSFTGMSKAYADQLSNLAMAYNKFCVVNDLRDKFGLTLEDFVYADGKLSGKTPDAEAFLFSHEYREFHYEGPLKAYAGSSILPTLDLISFEYKDGKFAIVYK